MQGDVKTMETKSYIDSKQKNLEEKGKAFLTIKSSIPKETDLSRVKKQIEIKERILNILKASESDWNDWIWQMQHRIIFANQLSKIMNFNDKRIKEIEEVEKKYRFAVSPYYLSLIDPDDSNDAIEKMSLPTLLQLSENGETDPTNEAQTNPAGSIVRRYPDRTKCN